MCPHCKTQLASSRRLSILLHLERVGDLPFLVLPVILFGILLQNSQLEQALFAFVAALPVLLRVQIRTVCSNCEGEIPNSKIERAL